MIHQPVQTATYDAQDRLESLGDIDYGFDVDGFMTSRGDDVFVYSTRGELLESSLDGGSEEVRWVYDGLGRQTARIDAAGTTQFLYGDPNDFTRLTAWRSPGGELSTLHYDERGHLIAVHREGAPGQWFYVATDPVGSPRIVVDQQGGIVRQILYDAFGRILTDTNPEFYLPIGFAGGLRDPATGLVRFGFRDYDPVAGRWTARDPIFFQGGQSNLYAYVGNDPLNRRDTRGLDHEDSDEDEEQSWDEWMREVNKNFLDWLASNCGGICQSMIFAAVGEVGGPFTGVACGALTDDTSALKGSHVTIYELELKKRCTQFGGATSEECIVLTQRLRHALGAGDYEEARDLLKNYNP